MVKTEQRYFFEPIKSAENGKPENSTVIEFDNTDIKEKTWSRKKENQKKLKKFNTKKIEKPFQRNQHYNHKRKFTIPKEALEKHSKGDGVNLQKIHTKIHKKKYEEKEKKIQYATEIAARLELLLPENDGDLKADLGETTTQFTQQEIRANVDLTAATKSFDLNLEFGPYRTKYTKNGRHLLIGGKKGHVAAFDWLTKKLHCEINVMESVHDVSFLHIETMFAVAQKNWVYIYDNQGIELHCVKRLNKVTRLEFLPYHFLLATCSDEGYLSWLDVSLGELVQQFNTHLGRLNVLCHNPWNACLCLGHAKGVVSMWSPNSREPLAKMLCHKAPISAIHVDPSGLYMATAATNRELKIWDIRKLEGPLQEYKLIHAATNLAFSQRKMLATSSGNILDVYRDCCTESAKRPYLRHKFNNPIGNFTFCPYEDVLGVATNRGFSSLLIPGCGEPNFDSLEANPFQTKKQRQESEVKALLEKIQPELITLDPDLITQVDVATLRDQVEAKKQLLHLKPPKINYEPRNKAKGKGGAAKMARNRKIAQEEAKKEFIKSTKSDLVPFNENKKKKRYNVMDRFVSKKCT